MRIHISVEGDLSRKVGEDLRLLISRAGPGMEVFLRNEDDGGEVWPGATNNPPHVAILCLTSSNCESSSLIFEAGIFLGLKEFRENSIEILILAIDLSPSQLSHNPWKRFRIVSVDDAGLQVINQCIRRFITTEAEVSSYMSNFRESAPIFINIVQELILTSFEEQRLAQEIPPVQFLYSDPSDSVYEVKYPDHWLDLIRQAAEAYDPDNLRIIKRSLDDHPNKNDRIIRALFDAQFQVRDFAGVLESYEKLSPEYKQDPEFVRRYATALLRLGKQKVAIEALLKIDSQNPAHPETLGLLGRAYKDLWQAALKEQNAAAAARWLRNAADAYTRGFKEFSDEYHLGVNAVSLLHLMGDANSMALMDELLPLVQNSIEKRTDSDDDYWALASLLELSVIKQDQRRADAFAEKIIQLSPDEITLKTTAAQLKLISEGLSIRDETNSWVKRIIRHLGQSAEG